MNDKQRVKIDLYDGVEFQLIHKEAFLATHNKEKRIIDLSLWMKVIYDHERQKIRRVCFFLRKDMELKISSTHTFEKTDDFEILIKNITYNNGNLLEDDHHQFVTEIVINDEKYKDHYTLPTREKDKIDDFINFDFLDSKLAKGVLAPIPLSKTLKKDINATYGNHICKSIFI